MTYIGNSAFANSPIAGTLSIPDSATNIGDMKFQGALITSLILRSTLAQLGGSIFQGMTTLTGTLSVPNSVQCIWNNAFSGTSDYILQ